jgi:uncharacterized phage-associated protein
VYISNGVYTKTMKILNLAYYIINKVEGVDPLKLQKLLYYTKVWGLVSGTPVIHEPFEKWGYGPVNPEVYKKFKQYSNGVIPKAHVPDVKVPKKEKELIDFILECYSPFDAVTLSAMTHQDIPWQTTPKNQEISDSSILKYYSKLPFAKNFPVDENKPFYPVETDFHYSFIFDMDNKTAKSLFFPSFKEYKKLMHQNKLMLEKSISTLGAKVFAS